MTSNSLMTKRKVSPLKEVMLIYFIFAPNGIIRPSRTPMVAYTKPYNSPSLLDLHTSTCLPHPCWGSQQKSFMDAMSTFKDILVVNDVPIPLAVDLDTLLYTYGEPTHDEKSTGFESITDCTTNAFDPASEEPKACHIASIIPETCYCAHLDHLSKTIVYTDGETTLDTLAMELDSLLYFKHGKYALDEVTVEFDPIFASADGAIYDIASIDTLVFGLE